MFQDHHEPIIDRDTWEKAQQLRTHRTPKRSECNPVRYNNRYWCSGKVQCGVCKGSYITKSKSAIYGKIRQYRCKKNDRCVDGSGGCVNKTFIDERILISCMQFAVRKVADNTDCIISDITKALEYACKNNDIDSRTNEIETKLTKLEQKKKKLLSLLVEEILSKEDYVAATKEIDIETFHLKNELNTKLHERNKILNSKNQITETLAYVKNYLEQAEPTTELYSKILEKIIVYEDKHIDIYLIGLINPISVKYSRKGRGKQYVVSCEEY